MSKNKDIRSFFTLASKKASVQAGTVSKKRPIEISSDEEDTPKSSKSSTFGVVDSKRRHNKKSIKKKSTPLKHKPQAKFVQNVSPSKIMLVSSDEEEIVPKKTVQQSKKQKIILSESEDEERTNKDTKKPAMKDKKLVQKNAIDFFGMNKVKQSSIVNKITSQSNEEHDSKKSNFEDKFEATLRQVDGNRSKNIQDSSNTLLDLDELLDADIINETVNSAQARASRMQIATKQTTSKKKNLNESLNNSGTNPDQEKYERRRQGAMLYQEYKNRPGPVNHGNKELPEGKPNCLENICFVRTGVLDSIDGDEFKDLVTKHSGRTVSFVSRKVNYLVVGVGPGPAKLSKAEMYGIKSITEDEFLDMILTRSGNEAKYVKMTNSAFIEDINITDVSKSGNKHKSDSISGKIEGPKKGDKKLSNESDIDVFLGWEPETKKSKSDDIPEYTRISLKKDSSKATRIPDSNISKPSTSNQIVKNVPIPKIQVESAPVDMKYMTLVDKYKPSVSTKIIGQSKNIELLTNWLKNWSKNHIGKDIPKLQKPSIYDKNKDGAYYKCAILSGPPGVGKTTTAQLLAKELGFDVVEYNASDTRSKKVLQEKIQHQLQSKSIASFAKDGRAPTAKHILIMDEVDGMSGNEDRGGMQELVELIKKTNIPIICMCNDRHHQKMRWLIDHCFELQFDKPNNQQIKGALYGICSREGVKLADTTYDRMITTAGNDVRQILNNLTMLIALKNNAKQSTEENSSDVYKFNSKDVVFGPWQVIRKQLDYKEFKDMSLAERSRLFYHDYSIGPLFMQENYLRVNPHEYHEYALKKERLKNIIQKIAAASNAISIGDVTEKKIRSTNNWSLLDTQGLFATVIPSYYVHGNVKCINFPAWLGRNSVARKFQRMLSELRNHTRSSLHCGSTALNLDYLRPLRKAIVSSLAKKNVDEAIDIMNTHNLLNSDFHNIIELTGWAQVYNDFKRVAVKTKSAFTRNYNISSHKLPYAIETIAKRKKHTAINNIYYGNENGSDDQNHTEDDHDITKSVKIKVNAKTDAKKSKNHASLSKSKKNGSRNKASNKKKE